MQGPVICDLCGENIPQKSKGRVVVQAPKSAIFPDTPTSSPPAKSMDFMGVPLMALLEGRRGVELETVDLEICPHCALSLLVALKHRHAEVRRNGKVEII